MPASLQIVEKNFSAPIIKLKEKKLLSIHIFNVLLLECLFLLCSCQKNHQSPTIHTVFDSVPITKPLNPLVNEISGIADSKINPGYLWGQEDSGNPSEIYLINHEGTKKKKIFLAGISNRDWEDIALFNGNIYIAETGDNAQAYNNYK